MLKRTHPNDKKRKYMLRKQYHDVMRRYLNSRYLVEVEPYQKGWVRFATLNDRVPQQEYMYVSKALELVQNYQYSNNRDFSYITRRKERKFRLYHLHMLHPNQVPKDSLIAKYFFHTLIESPRRKLHERRFEERYIFNQDNWVTVVVEPNMITHEERYNTELESEYDRLRNKLKKSGDWFRMYEDSGDYYDWNERRLNFKYRLHNDE